MFGFNVQIGVFVLIQFVHSYYLDPDLYAINTEGCQIPGYPLMSDSIRELVTRPSGRPSCSETVPLVVANDTHITVLNEYYEQFLIMDQSLFSCCYRNFSAQGNLENVAYGICQEFNTTIKGEHEFVRVECYNAGEKIYEDLFRFKMYSLEQPRQHDKSAFSILMFGIDGISRKNFLRTMGRTSNFMKKRNSIQLQGYNKLGDNSFPNMFPLLSGKSYEEVKTTCFKNYVNTHTCKFMWEIYQNAGYYTALAADSAIGVLGVYESLLDFKPTDFYMQTFMYETRHVYKDRTYDYHLCLRNRTMYMELLKFARDVIETVQRDKLFGLFWEESVSHGHINYPYIMDNDYYNILNLLEKKNYLEDTIVIFFSDHGARFGQILATEQGRLESRLPLFEIMFPVRFRRRYKLAFKNFVNNSFKLTTANDVYKTLLDLIDPKLLDDDYIMQRTEKMDYDAKGISLFLPIPGNRTCKSLDIPEHWCACAQGEKVTVGNKVQSKAARYVVDHINQILSEYPKCQKLKIAKIIDVRATKDKLTSMKKFRVMIETSPGRAIFEATLVQENSMWALSGTVSRLNSYSDQSKCVSDPFAKNYCYCRVLKSSVKTHLFKTNDLIS